MKGAHGFEKEMLVACAPSESIAQAQHEVLARQIDVAEQHTLGVQHQRTVAIARDDREPFARRISKFFDDFFADGVGGVFIVACLTGEERQRLRSPRPRRACGRLFIGIGRTPYPHRPRLTETRRHPNLDAAPIPGEIHAAEDFSYG